MITHSDYISRHPLRIKSKDGCSGVLMSHLHYYRMARRVPQAPTLTDITPWLGPQSMKRGLIGGPNDASESFSKLVKAFRHCARDARLQLF